MAEPTLADLQSRRDEVEAQIAEMQGAPNFSVGGLSVDESTLYQDLCNELGTLNFRISNVAAGGSPGDNARAQSMGTPSAW